MKKECTQIRSFLPVISSGRRWYYSALPTADYANRLNRFPSLPQKCTKPIVLNTRLSSARQKFIPALSFPGLLTIHSCPYNLDFPLSSLRFIKNSPFFSSQFFTKKVILHAESYYPQRILSAVAALAFKIDKEANLMLRSIKKAYDIVRRDDPETAITVHTIRMWCKEGKIKYLTAGNKILVDVQSLMDYIAIKE